MGRKNRIYSPHNYDKCRELGEARYKKRLAVLGAGPATLYVSSPNSISREAPR